jgi:hypothetical protein
MEGSHRAFERDTSYIRLRQKVLREKQAGLFCGQVVVPAFRPGHRKHDFVVARDLCEMSIAICQLDGQIGKFLVARNDREAS